MGGKHTIESNNLKFVMLSKDAWRGTNSLYYKCIKVYKLFVNFLFAAKITIKK